MASPDLIWLLVKNSNKFLVKRNGNSSASVQFSSEPNNLYNLNTYKYSGLANKKTVAVAPAGEKMDIVLTTTKKKKSNKPASYLNRSLLKSNFKNKAKVIINQVGDNGYRPDLKRAALARLTSVHKSLCRAEKKKKPAA
ncbi:hypothetical protein SELMODRAFT_164298 [Selaginella moellendorffii]|uniref:Ribosomal eL28/Mak16 domain-containing protein n=1 Tax=Selaginella moellendorffii TaxID=88036 RepID=D8QNB0_SELML|nr:60S ribosomal protein L28-2 [Selaginella moellendorffii]XP_002966813.1 60S ribosomal protein L28-2 [Selaginella moellendorffii]EFJ31412.1 hypothetical protein SELMODRAFT_270600 [Selaginella moellendorffii]EFJ38730.1 hypothetical protein SELMODRAFT_164298 [Selaginella moellendorffii]|eukprot:XP_002961191.1 60S ribosomal protein L28-2 [Selaginella moellendorffii]